MPRYRKWVLTLGLIASTQLVTQAAGPFPGQSGGKPAAKASSSYNDQVAKAIASALSESQIEFYSVDIVFKGGVATLKGAVPDAQQRDRASAVVSRVSGVKSVDNRMTVVAPKGAPSAQSAPTSRPRQGGIMQAGFAPAGRPQINQTSYVPEDPAAKAALAQANQQVAQRIADALPAGGLKGFDIQVQYENGVAVLSGQVANSAQKMRASQIASSIPGVQQVDNRLVGPTPQAGPRGPYGQMGPQGPQGPYGQMAPQGPQGPFGPMAQGPYGQVAPAGAYQPGAVPPNAPMAMGGPGMGMGMGGPTGAYNQPNLPEYAWPSYAAYPNYGQVNYPKQYSASAWPYIGPFYPYPQVPLGWRKVQLEWDDGYWNLNFNPRTDRWWWFMNPKNW